ncbi:MAG TPA: MotA/TolQ/ExbB proton channel family protein [Halalkalibaculum sp.]|nr:MotA/TolQ/ExbB proton channel family protein [Halalkalibaculum sp.]
MTDLFYAGGPLFMGILTILLLIILSMSAYRIIQIVRGNVDYATSFRHRLSYIKSVGLFALVFGILAQLMGLYQAFSAIEMAGDISPAILMGGLKVSMITTIYGVIIFLISYLLWMGLHYMATD